MSGQPRPFAEADVHAFVDGQMDLDRRAVFVQALSSDPDLRARVERWRRQNEALSATFASIASEPVPVRLMPVNLGKTFNLGKTWRPEADRPAAGQDAAHPPRNGPASRLAAAVLAAFLAGAGVTAVAALSGLFAMPATGARVADAALPAGTRALPLRAYEAHQTYATDLNHPVEVPASDVAHLLKWVQHRLSMPVRIPDLRHEGWTLLGGRVLPGELGPAAFLLYGNGVDRLGLYMARTNAHQADASAIYDNGAGLATVAYWVEEPVGYALTTSRDAAWLEREGPALVKSVRTQAKDNASAF